MAGGGLTPDRVKADYAASFARVGEDVFIRRYTGTGPTRTHVDTPARARVTGYKPDEIVGSITQGDQRAIVLVDAAVSAILPVLTSDKLIIRAKPETAIKAVDDNVRRVAGVLIALEIHAAG